MAARRPQHKQDALEGGARSVSLGHAEGVIVRHVIHPVPVGAFRSRMYIGEGGDELLTRTQRAHSRVVVTVVVSNSSESSGRHGFVSAFVHSGRVSVWHFGFERGGAVL